jgi:carbon-monoxide dehydrogenase small subunit
MPRNVTVSLNINGAGRHFETDHRALLVELIRGSEEKGTRIGCLTGDCGACTVLLDGQPTKSCLVLAVSVDGSEVTTIEGSHCSVAAAVKDAFVAKKGFQCGYCTSGMVVVVTDFLKANPSPSSHEIRGSIAGNLCRCTGYDDIVSAIEMAARTLKNTSPKSA